MNEEQFWSLIESCVKRDHSVNSSRVVEHYNAISAACGHLSQPDLKEFHSIFYRLREQARTSPLIEAAFIFSHGQMDDETVDVFLTGVIMHGREFYLGCLESPESTLLSMECPQELQMYAGINIAFQQLDQDMGWNYVISVASPTENLALMKTGIREQKSIEEIVRQEMPSLFMKCWQQDRNI